MPSVVLVHGYSETSLGAYQHLPELLAAAGFDTIVLSAFDSLDDVVRIDDLAEALELRVGDLEATGFDVRDASFVCHSTGALVARRWILNRLAAASPGAAVLPARIVTMAGANHGSSLAEIGKTPIGYLQKLVFKHVLSVGKGVLTDLSYGSDFLWRLNSDWLAAWNDDDHPLHAQVLAFSLGGDSIGTNEAMKIFWATSESGSDNTVRISGANLNYTLLDANPDSNPPSITPLVLKRLVPHLILPGYSHFDTVSGILHANDSGDAAFSALLAALTTTPAGYDALAQQWKASNDAWVTQKQGDANSTIVFELRDQSGKPIPDCMICFWDVAELKGDPQSVTLPAPATPGAAIPEAETPAEATVRQGVLDASLSAGDAILANSPIHNDVAVGSYSFYLNYPTWVGAGAQPRQHAVYIEAVSDSQYIEYKPTIYQAPESIDHLIQPNQFTYVRVRLNRNPDNEYALYEWTPAFDLATRAAAAWRPFPDRFRVPSRPKPG